MPGKRGYYVTDRYPLRQGAWYIWDTGTRWKIRRVVQNLVQIEYDDGRIHTVKRLVVVAALREGKLAMEPQSEREI